MRINIHHKITIIFCLILAVILFGVFTYLDSTLKDYTYSRIRSALIKETLLAKLFLEKDFPGYPRLKEIDDIADQAGESLSSRVTIIGMDGKVLGDSDLNGEKLHNVENHLYRLEVQEALKSGIGESARFSTTVQKNMLYIAVLFGKGDPLGVVRLSLPLSDIEVVSGHLKKVLFAALAIAFCIAVVASSGAARFISKPIEDISSAARKIAAGDFSKRISLRTKDEIGGLAGAFNDMSKEICSKIEELKDNKARLEAVLLSMFDGVMVVDSRGMILLMNRALKNILAVEHAPEGRKPLEVVRNIEVQEIADKVLEPGSGVESREISILLPKEKELIIHGTPIVRGEKIEGAVLVFHDVTDMRRLERIRKDFVANVSHELRTPVSSIKGFAETLSARALDDKESAKEFIKIIEENSNRLVRLIDDLLDLSRIESGNISLNLKPHSVYRMVEKVISEMQEQANKRSISIRNNIADDIPDVPADKSLISQVFLNLIDNAIKYTEKNGLVTISAEQKNGFVKIDVEDSGIGIPEKDIPRVFERFYCVDKTRSRRLGGTGLGLSIVKHVVEEHGGQVSVQSVLGRGSTFTFTLPKA
ncbi:MAG: PAS domain-containing sensor histidine kinase [Candidatus Makaraimicrobium thalassicum]|nr:MAG: PAS domain-containing sensor histidine kinase [Candidatus Omnitrophota bacterium]